MHLHINDSKSGVFLGAGISAVYKKIMPDGSHLTISSNAPEIFAQEVAAKRSTLPPPIHFSPVPVAKLDDLPRQARDNRLGKNAHQKRNSYG